MASTTMSKLTTVRDQAVKRYFLMLDLARAIPWRGAWKLHDRNADIVVWIHHRYPKSWLTYLLREDTILKDAGLIAGVVKAKVPIRIVSGKGAEQLTGATILATVHPYNPDRAQDYAAGLLVALRRIEAKGNTLCPSADEAEWWENKVFMHRRFDELGINCPRTRVDVLTESLDFNSLHYPLLAKEPHSQGSAGLHKIDSAEALRRLRADLRSQGETELLLQDLVDMGRDLRATMVGDRVVHHYFRINTGTEWQPTSTRRGSLVDFETFPEKWRTRIGDVFALTGMRTGAFDICWSGDDLDGEPIFLEVSPSYTPNPPPPPAFADQPYYAFKKQLRGPDSFGRAFVRVVFEIQEMVLEEWGITS